MLLKFALIVILVGIGVFFIGTPAADAVVDPFGGPILFVLPCEAPPGLWIIIGPPTPRSLILTPASLIFLFGAFHVGANMLGLDTPAPIPCIWFVPEPVVIGIGFPIFEIGTSL